MLDPLYRTSLRLMLFLGASLIGLSACSGPAGDDTARRTPVTAPDTVVAVLDGEPLTVSEFERRYRRSEATLPAADVDSVAVYEDFLRRYVDFRLKVLEARDAGYHELDDLQQEIATYRAQLARPYLLGRHVVDPLIREMYERRKEAVSASHILLRIPGEGTPADTLQAFNRLAAIRDSIEAGADFGDMAFRHSEDPSASGAPGSAGYRGYLGWFGGGRMVESFEDMAYATPAGEMTDIFRSRFGYHLMMVHDRREMPYDREIAHIMIRPSAPTPADSASAEQRLREVGEQLQAGEPFEDVARELSDDRNSAQNGGSLGVVSFDTGLPFSMRDSAFAMTEIGSISGPVETQFGSHYIKLIAVDTLGTLEEEYEDLRTRINRLPRLEAAQDAYARSIRNRLDISVDSSLVREWERTMTPDSLFRSLSRQEFESEMLESTLATIEGAPVTVGQFSRWISTQRVPSGSSPAERVFNAMDIYLDEQALGYQVDKLEENDAEFRDTMREFRDGLLLFRLMEDSVWTAAAEDTTALLERFEKNRQRYRFDDRNRIISFSSPSDSVLTMLRDRASDIGAVPAFEEIATDTTVTIRSDTTFVEGRTDSVYDRALDVAEGQLTDPVSYNRGFIVLLNDGIDPARLKTFEEARAEVVNEHQEAVERRLLERLRRKYDARLYPEHLENAFQGPDPGGE